MELDSNLKRYAWACRRGMLELDLFLQPFFEKEFLQLTPSERQIFIHLLDESDQDLYSWLLGYKEPTNNDQKQLVGKIQSFRRNLSAASCS